jgi:hypothetical protein
VQVKIDFVKVVKARKKLKLSFFANRDFVANHRYILNRTIALNGHQFLLLVDTFAAFVFNSVLIGGCHQCIFHPVQPYG